jgi:aminoglycoside phosphotransferase family enzyme
MIMRNQIFSLIKSGKIEGFSAAPKMIETVISRVFVFNKDDIVLKLYKRDNDWWNINRKDLSRGISRINFIRQDFEFNRFLNPKIYFDLKAAVIDGGIVKLADPKSDDDELVIVMHEEDISGIFTEVLYENKLTSEEYKNIGRSFAKIKMAIPKSFLPDSKLNWYEQMAGISKNLSGWALSEKDFPKEVAEKGLALFGKKIEENKVNFELINRDDLFVLIDCNSENLIYSNRELRFIDAYPPKDDWQLGTFDVDIFRTASDIYALAGEDAYNAYLEGVDEIAGDLLDKNLKDLYLLYSAMIMVPYFFMLSKKDKKYQAKAEKYLSFVRKLVN